MGMIYISGQKCVWSISEVNALSIFKLHLIEMFEYHSPIRPPRSEEKPCGLQ